MFEKAMKSKNQAQKVAEIHKSPDISAENLIERYDYLPNKKNTNRNSIKPANRGSISSEPERVSTTRYGRKLSETHQNYASSNKVAGTKRPSSIIPVNPRVLTIDGRRKSTANSILVKSRRSTLKLKDSESITSKVSWEFGERGYIAPSAKMIEEEEKAKFIAEKRKTMENMHKRPTVHKQSIFIRKSRNEPKENVAKIASKPPGELKKSDFSRRKTNKTIPKPLKTIEKSDFSSKNKTDHVRNIFRKNSNFRFKQVNNRLTIESVDVNRFSETSIKQDTERSTLDEGQLPEPLKLIIYLKKVANLLKALRSLKRQTSEEEHGKDSDLKRSSSKATASFHNYLARRSSHWSGNLSGKKASKLQSILTEVSSGTSSDGYTDWKIQIWQDYQNSLDETLAPEEKEPLSPTQQKYEAVIKNLDETKSVNSLSSAEEERHEEDKKKILPHRHDKRLDEDDHDGMFVDAITGLRIQSLSPPSNAMSSSEVSSLSSANQSDKDSPNTCHILKDQELDDSLFDKWDQLYDQIEKEIEVAAKEEEALNAFMQQSEALKLPEITDKSSRKSRRQGVEPKQSEALKSPEITEDSSTKLFQVSKSQRFKDVLPTICLEFLDELVTRCVDYVEQTESSEMLKRSLCKRKIFKKLITLLADYEEEQEHNRRLQNAVTEIYRRRKQFSLITVNNPKIEQNYRDNYFATCKKLDIAMLRFEEAREFSSIKIKEVTEQHKQWENKCKEVVASLEELIMKTMSPERPNLHRPNLERYLNFKLKKMNVSRQLLSDWRYKLIRIQHIHSVLLQRSKNLQHIGEGLTLDQCEYTRKEVKELISYNHEMDFQNQRYRDMTDVLIAKASHYKKRNAMLRDFNKEFSFEIERLYGEVYSLRHWIGILKETHNAIRHEISIVKWNAGIIENTDLMLDYDRTANRIRLLKADIESWKQKLKVLRPMIDAMEIKCAYMDSIKTAV